MMRLWLIRLGKNGEYEAAAFQDNVLTIGFGIAEDISVLKDREALIVKMAELFPNDKPNKHRNFAAQVNQFVSVAQVGDLVVSSIKTSSTIAIGRIDGPYRPGANGEATRPVKWLRTDIPRDAFRQDLLYSFGAFMTVCEVTRSDALARVKKVLETGQDPGHGTSPAVGPASPQVDASSAVDAADQPVNLEQVARDQIERRIGSVFTGHDFTRLVSAILEGHGYQTRVSPPGADGGVDIVAGSGPLGLGSPSVVVQVKSGNIVVDDPTLQALRGNIAELKADDGLIVGWGGFKSTVRSRSNVQSFQVRFWGRQELIDNLFAVYDRLPEEIKAELPLARVWTLLLEEDAGVEA
jgi:restriction system protein